MPPRRLLLRHPQGLPQWPYVQKELLAAQHFKLRERMSVKKTYSFTGDLKIYEKLYPLLEQDVPKPDLVIYMQASVPVLLERIRRRARDYEVSIEAGYLERLSEAYSYFFFHYRETPLLVVNTDDIDFVNDPADLDALIGQIVRCRRGTQVYVPVGSKRPPTLPGA